MISAMDSNITIAKSTVRNNLKGFFLFSFALYDNVISEDDEIIFRFNLISATDSNITIIVQSTFRNSLVNLILNCVSILFFDNCNVVIVSSTFIDNIFDSELKSSFYLLKVIFIQQLMDIIVKGTSIF